ncbi:hypothetical protein EDD86DRAFT_192705 [Gorgonomyces haynaldii]|nr:hypothetical protein EDD86DRAFT_192705 [Gorgonomyces haynaldii]
MSSTSGKPQTPELKKYLDKRMYIQLSGNRTLIGILRGFDPFLNIVLEDTVEQVSEVEQNPIGSVVVRGNSIIVMEALEKIPL